MTKEELFDLAEKALVFFKTELKGKSVCDIAGATIFALGALASEGCDRIILPETICRYGLSKLDLMKGELYDNLKNS